MRQLHPVSFHEKFVASGTYTFYNDDLPTGDVEYWSIHEPGPGSYSIRADHDGRFGTEVSWLFEGLYIYGDARGHMERFDVQLFGEEEMLARFIFNGEAEISATVGRDMQPIRTLPLPPGYVVVPPCTVAELLFLSARGPAEATRVPVFVAHLDLRGGRVDGGRIEMSTMEPLPPETCVVGDKEHHCQGYRLHSDSGMDISGWFDQYGILMRYETTTGQRALLTDYVHRPE